MSHSFGEVAQKFWWSLPWLLRYPAWRAREMARRVGDGDGPRHLIFVVANHFEPSWSENGSPVDWSEQSRRVDRWHDLARAAAATVRDSNGVPFQHTNFYPAEQYHPRLLDQLSALQSEGLGEVEVHLHHGVDQPDTASELTKTLIEFRDTLAERHKCLSRWDNAGGPAYAFVHGNTALANSAAGRFCGVDEEMQILADTGCYVDMTLPSAPDRSQVPRLNAIYECGNDKLKARPHRSGPTVRVGDAGELNLPLIFTGPLVFIWNRRYSGLPLPRLDDGGLTANQPLDKARLDRWTGARIGVRGMPKWQFIKLYCHAFFPFDQASTIGERARRFFSDVVESGEREGTHKVHFASAREAVNMLLAARDRLQGDPHQYRNYRLRTIMRQCISLFTYSAGLLVMGEA